MTLARVLGPSLTQPPLPAFWKLYARRFRAVARMVARIALGSIKLLGEPSDDVLDSDKVVLYANHPSFWDPLVLAILTERCWPNHPVVSPIDEKALRTHWYFRGLGFFGVQPSVAGMRVFLDTVGGALSTRGPCLVAVTPEGRFSPPGGTSLRLQRGLARALHLHQGQSVTVVPVAIDYTASAWRRRAYLKFGEPLHWGGGEGVCHESQLHLTLTNRLSSVLADLKARPNRSKAAEERPERILDLIGRAG